MQQSTSAAAKGAAGSDLPMLAAFSASGAVKPLAMRLLTPTEPPLEPLVGLSQQAAVVAALARGPWMPQAPWPPVLDQLLSCDMTAPTGAEALATAVRLEALNLALHHGGRGGAVSYTHLTLPTKRIV